MQIQYKQIKKSEQSKPNSDEDKFIFEKSEISVAFLTSIYLSIYLSVFLSSIHPSSIFFLQNLSL
jgi:hypothetical protein